MKPVITIPAGSISDYDLQLTSLILQRRAFYFHADDAEVEINRDEENKCYAVRLSLIYEYENNIPEDIDTVFNDITAIGRLSGAILDEDTHLILFDSLDLSIASAYYTDFSPDGIMYYPKNDDVIDKIKKYQDKGIFLEIDGKVVSENTVAYYEKDNIIGAQMLEYDQLDRLCAYSSTQALPYKLTEFVNDVENDR